MRLNIKGSLPIFAVTVFIASVFTVALVFAQTVFGPKEYARPGGENQVTTDSFTADPAGQYKLILSNNNPPADPQIAAYDDIFVYLNDERLVGIHNFSEVTEPMEIPVSLRENNTLTVEVRGKECGPVTIRIETVE